MSHSRDTAIRASLVKSLRVTDYLTELRRQIDSFILILERFKFQSLGGCQPLEYLDNLIRFTTILLLLIMHEEGIIVKIYNSDILTEGEWVSNFDIRIVFNIIGFVKFT